MNIFMGITEPYIFICLFIAFIYIYFTATFKFWSNLGVPFKKPRIIIGNYGDLLLFRKSQCEGVYKMYNWFKNSPYFGVFRVRQPIFFVRDRKLIKKILIKDFDCFINRGIPTNTQELLSRHLFNFEGEQWRILRSKLTPLFSSIKIKLMFPLLINCQNKLEELINNFASNNSTIDVRDLANKFTVDVTGTCAFGIHINALTDNNCEFQKIIKKLSQPNYKSVLLRILRTSLPKIYNLLGIQLIHPEVTHFFQDIVRQIIKQREHEENNRNDLMDLLIKLKNNPIENNSLNLNFDESMITAQAFGFFFSGYEPSATTIAFCLHELALNPEIQKKTRSDIWSAIKNNDGNLTYQAVQEMNYLEAVVLETLRKYPPAPMTSRRCEYPYEIPGTKIILPAGMRVVIPIYGIHHDPEYYPDPDQFNPDRFIDRAEINKHSQMFFPFGDGPRNCIGMKFGMLQIKMGIISFLKRHEIVISEKTVVPIKLSRRSIVTSSENELWLKIKLL